MLFGLLDLYTMHLIAIPYYTGLTAHRPNGSVAAFHPHSGAVSTALERLAAFKPPWLNEPLLAVLWLAYLLATMVLIALSFAVEHAAAARTMIFVPGAGVTAFDNGISEVATADLRVLCPITAAGARITSARIGFVILNATPGSEAYALIRM